MNSTSNAGRAGLLCLLLSALALQILPAAPESPKALAPAEFARLIRDFSEEGGYFRSDNFTSNETSYLHVLGKLKELDIAGGAYIGVGPEQNFTYIAHIRPEIAFIVDIRRQAVLQHLLYKAVFQSSSNRLEFLSMLLSRPADPVWRGNTPGIEAALEHFQTAEASDALFRENLRKIVDTIQRRFQVELTREDRERLEYVFRAFRDAGTEIAFGPGGFSGGGGAWGRFPSLKDLVLQQDQNGKRGSYLASDDDFRFVRELHLKNRIIPVVGDFAGNHALTAVAGYLRAHRYTLRALYTSNVEQFLFQGGKFPAFMENIRKFPVDDRSVIIRAVSRRIPDHPAYLPGHRTATILQRIPVLLGDYDSGSLKDYRSLVTSNFISGVQP
jgi:hypothetical protein